MNKCPKCDDPAPKYQVEYRSHHRTEFRVVCKKCRASGPWMVCTLTLILGGLRHWRYHETIGGSDL